MVVSMKTHVANSFANRVASKKTNVAPTNHDDGDGPHPSEEAVQNLLALNLTLRQSLEREEDARSRAVCAKEKVEERLANEISRVQSLTDSLVKSESNARMLKAILEEHSAKERRETAQKDKEIAVCKSQIQNLELTSAQLGIAKDAEILHRWRSEDSADVARNDTIVLQREVNMHRQKINWLLADRTGRREVALRAKALARDGREELIRLRREVYDAQNLVTDYCQRIMRAMNGPPTPRDVPARNERAGEFLSDAERSVGDPQHRRAPIRKSFEEFLPG
eukprot:GEMP01027939.1.p1 GENE.GEMP01027939.1~~GEMP01027939.1.p1  ORF type:complete len:280 (+),score=70.10 GEMP01027939.1:705-1544(+)